jgi:anti-anti-sigma factor
MMDIPVQTVGDVAVVVVPVSELDADATPEFKRVMAPVLEAHAKVVFDLSQVRFVDSSGLGAFLSCLRKAIAKGGDLKLCCVSKQVRTVIELVRMHRMVEIFDTVDQAVSAFNSKNK